MLPCWINTSSSRRWTVAITEEVPASTVDRHLHGIILVLVAAAKGAVGVADTVGGEKGGAETTFLPIRGRCRSTGALRRRLLPQPPVPVARGERQESCAEWAPATLALPSPCEATATSTPVCPAAATATQLLSRVASFFRHHCGVLTTVRIDRRRRRLWRRRPRVYRHCRLGWGDPHTTCPCPQGRPCPQSTLWIWRRCRCVAPRTCPKLEAALVAPLYAMCLTITWIPL